MRTTRAALGDGSLVGEQEMLVAAGAGGQAQRCAKNARGCALAPRKGTHLP